MIAKNESAKNKLSVLSFGIAIGVAEGIYMMVFAWMVWLSSYGTHFIQLLAEVMPGYGPSFIGGIIGGIEGFLDGFIFGLLASLVYNLCLCCRCGKSSDLSENKNMNK